MAKRRRPTRLEALANDLRRDHMELMTTPRSQGESIAVGLMAIARAAIEIAASLSEEDEDEDPT